MTRLIAARQLNLDLEQLLIADRAEPDLERDAGRDPESLRHEVRVRTVTGPTT